MVREDRLQLLGVVEEHIERADRTRRGIFCRLSIGKIDLDAGMRKTWPYLGVLLLGLFAVAAIPWLLAGFL